MAAAVAASKQVGGKWIPPLPHGWEARYDEENKAFFFIDHVHKKTQWDDPRFHGQQKQSQPPPQSTSAAAASSLGHGDRGPRKSYGAIALQDLSPGQPKKDRRQNSRSSVLEASLTNEVDIALVNKLKAEFPNATKELITDIVVLCHNSERQAREQLKDLGFFVNSSTSRSSTHASPHRNASGGSAPTKRSPDKHPQAAAASATSPTRKEISEGDKRKMLAEVKELFPKLDQYVIRIALNECHHNLEEVKTLLSAWEKSHTTTDQARGATTGSGNTSVSTSVASVRTFSPAAGSLEPRGLDEDVANKTDSQRSSQQSGQSAGHTLSPKRDTTVPSVTQMLAKGDAAPSKSSCSQHARAKQVTKMSEHLLNTTSDLLNHLATSASCCTNGEDVEEREEERKKKLELEADVAEDEDKRPKSSSAAAAVSQPTAITTQPVVEHKPQTSSLYRTEAKGPDASLRKGPDSTLLTSDYTQASGPDKTLHTGPDRSRQTGPQGAAGPDLSLRCGPQSAILQENRNNGIVPLSITASCSRS